MLRKIRIILATVMFLCITWLFVDFTGTARHWFAWMPKLQFLEAVLALNVAVIIGLVVLTLVFGRIYCSVICPLGIMQDIFGWLGKKQKKNRYTYSKEMKWLRYPVLVLFIIALVAGIGTLFQLLAPYSAFGRIATYLLQPVWIAGNNVLASIAEHYDSYAFYHVSKDVPNYYVVTIIAVWTWAIVAALAWKYGRTYCNTVCPVGTFLSFFSRFSWLKIKFDVDKCKNCSLCTKNCKASCIDFKTHSVDYSRCVVCGDCLESCKFGALKYSSSLEFRTESVEFATAAPSAQPSEAVANSQLSARRRQETLRSRRTLHSQLNTGRRSFLLASALATTAAIAQEKENIDGGLAEIEDKAAPDRQTPLTPPGSLSARNMEQHCTGCQLCVSECPNNVLRPSTDLMHFMQPVMSYERGYCRPECNRCSTVCPAGAIKPITLEEKSSTQIGHAVWIKKNCVAVTDGVECDNCARHCPVGAIEMVQLDEDDDESPWVPAINESRCIGCGACEYVCPSRPFSAIYVEGHEVHKNY